MIFSNPKITEQNIKKEIENWQKSNSKVALHMFLGISLSEYQKWCNQNYEN
jgi:hypothetical protein